MQEAVRGQVQPTEPHVAAQERQAEALQVPAVQQSLPERGSAGATHEISPGYQALRLQRVRPSVHREEQLAETRGRAQREQVSDGSLG